MRNEENINQILQGHSLIIKIYPLEVSNIQRGAAELNITQQKWINLIFNKNGHAISALLYTS